MTTSYCLAIRTLQKDLVSSVRTSPGAWKSRVLKLRTCLHGRKVLPRLSNNSEPLCRDAGAKRPRFAPVSVRRTSDADTALSSFIDLSRSRPQSLDTPNDIDLDKELELRRRKSTATSIVRLASSSSTELPAVPTSNAHVTPTNPTLAEPTETLEGDGNALLDDWSCKQTLVFSSRKSFAWLHDGITAKDRAAAVLDACAPQPPSSAAATAEESSHHLANFERSRINFVRSSHPPSVDATTKAAWIFSAASLCTQLEHSLTPYFYAVGDASVLFLAADTIPGLASALVTAIVSQSTPGLRSALKTANIEYETLLKVEQQATTTVHRADLRLLSHVPGIQVRETEELEKGRSDTPLIIRNASALRLLSSGLLGCPMLISPRPFLGCTVTRSEATHSQVQRGTEKLYSLRLSGWLLPTQIRAIVQAVQDIHQHPFQILCSVGEHAAFNAVPGISCLGAHTVREIDVLQDGTMTWKISMLQL